MSQVSFWREKGKEKLEVQGSEHYGSEIQPIDMIASYGHLEGFCIGNIMKYASRFENTRNPKDLSKIIDYAYILAGYAFE